MKKSGLSLKAALNSIPADQLEASNNTDTIVQTQKKLLEVYSDVFEMCEENGLKLFLQGGTLLGKVRHDGFIPWDDDMDLGLMRSDYNRFIDLFDSELSDRYELKAPGYAGGADTRFIHVYKKNNNDSEHRISIDIFPIDFAPDNKLVRTVLGVRSNALMFIAGSKEFIQICKPEMKAALTSTLNGRINYYMRKITADLSRPYSLEKLYVSIDKAIRWKKKSGLCTSATGRWHYFGELQKSDVFLPLKRTEFCGLGAWTLNNDKEYLRHNYGDDYMKIPAEHQRERHFG